jgi:hypothetical protein
LLIKGVGERLRVSGGRWVGVLFPDLPAASGEGLPVVYELLFDGS